MTTSTLDAELTDVLQAWCATHPVSLCVVFGSQATGLSRPDSDVDIAVWPTTELEPLTKLEWVHDLMLCLGHEVSLVLVTPALDPVLGIEIARHGIPVYAETPETWPRACVRFMQLYNDALPFLRREREALHRAVEEWSRRS
ncbi:MAG: nucleotidyltransferase domain-containing protein [Caldilineaceae bacterium]|nr:nucleotidyltransferase domain-containing protein [Caldilineaceae bacterium]